MTFPVPDIYCYTACFALIFSGVMCGTIRWFHMCRPYNKMGEYFYPARRQVTFFYTAFLLLLPYLMHIGSADAWLFARIFGILYLPVCSTMLIRCYFSEKDSKNKRLYRNGIVAVVPFACLLTLFVFALIGDNMLADSKNLILWTMGALGVGLLYPLCGAVLRLKKRIDEYSVQSYSNTDDFPYKFASRIFFIPILLIALMWVVFLTDSRMVKMWTDLLLVLWHIIFLIIILSPQQKEKVLEVEAAAFTRIQEKKLEEQVVEKMVDNSKANRGSDIELLEKELIPRMEKAFTKDRIFLNPNLTIQDLATAIGSNRSYVSALMIKTHGSFLVYVNHLRIEYSILLQDENPDIKQADLILRSGFNNRNSYKKWLESYEESKKSKNQ